MVSPFTKVRCEPESEPVEERVMRTRGSYLNQRGFTLVEIMIVVSIIALLAMIAMPSALRSRAVAARQTCINNLRKIDGAKAQWAMECRKSSADVPSDTDLFGVARYMRTKPTCPSHGSYQLESVGQPPDCTEPGHIIQ